MKASVNQAAVARVHMNAARVSGIRLGGDSGKKRANAFHPSLVDYWNFKGKGNTDKDRNTVKGLLGNILTAYGFGWSLGSGYGLFKENYLTYNKAENVFVTDDHSAVIMNFVPANTWVLSRYEVNKLNATKVKITGLTASNQLAYWYIDANRSRAFISIPEDGEYDLPESIGRSEPNIIGFIVQNALTKNVTIQQISEYEGAIVLDGVDDFLKFDKLNYKIGTVIIKHVPLNLNGTWQYIFDAETQRTFAAHQTGVITTSFNNKETIDNYLVLSYNADNIKTITTPFDISKSFRNNEFLSMALYEIAIYQDILTGTEIEKEITKMQSL